VVLLLCSVEIEAEDWEGLDDCAWLLLMARANRVCGLRPLPSFLCLNAASFWVAGERMASEGDMYVSVALLSLGETQT
jgi:hypothetical protein